MGWYSQMEKTLATTIVAAAVVLLTATFSFAEYATAGVTNFPFFQLGCLIVGGLIMVSLKRKYDKMYVSEVVGVFALYTLLMTLFTSPVIEVVKTIVS
jgi:FtsH-binding integral membrane protein